MRRAGTFSDFRDVLGRRMHGLDDVHRIPRYGSEPSHLHHDIRYLVVANGSNAPQASEESNAVRWFTRAEIEREIGEESLLRMVRRIIPG